MEFLGDIAFILEVAVLCAGLVVLHFSKKEKSPLLKWAAWIMIVSGGLAALCTSSYWFYYYFNGVFEASAVMHNYQAV